MVDLLNISGRLMSEGRDLIQYSFIANKISLIYGKKCLGQVACHSSHAASRVVNIPLAGKASGMQQGKLSGPE